MCIFPSNNCRRCHLKIHLTFVEAVIGFGTRQWRAHTSMDISMLACGQLHSQPLHRALSWPSLRSTVCTLGIQPAGLTEEETLAGLRHVLWTTWKGNCGGGGGVHYTKSGISKGSGEDPGQASLLLQRIFASLGWKQFCSVNSPRVTKFLRLENEMDKQ